MNSFIIISKGQEQLFSGNAKRKGNELNWKSIRPIEINIPVDKLVLPEIVLQDVDFIEAFPELINLPSINESEITWVILEEV
jgi:hypothetical protein